MKAVSAVYTDPHRPWEENPDWINGEIHSTAASSVRASLFFAVLWNLICIPISWFALQEIGFAWPDPAWLVLLFPAVGLILAASATTRYLQWKKFGRLNLNLDPFPGSIGGEVGGYLDIPLPYGNRDAISVTLNCVHVHYSRNSKGGRTRHETVKWRRQAEVQIEPAAVGTKLKFLVSVDPGLPDSQQPSESHHQWVIRVHIDRPGIDLDRDFIVPVFDTGRTLQSRIRVSASNRLPAAEIPGRIARVTPRGSGLELYFPAGRGRGIGTGLFLAGLIFAAAGGFLNYELYESIVALSQDGMFFQVGILGIMAPVFSLVGLLLTLAGLYTMLNSLSVNIHPAGVETTRRILGIPLRRGLKSGEIRSIVKKITAQSGQGSRGQVFYTISALTHSGRRVILGDGIKGQPVAERLLELIKDALPGDPEVTAESGAGISPILERASQARKPGSWVRWVGGLIALLIFAFFVYDFARMFSG